MAQPRRDYVCKAARLRKALITIKPSPNLFATPQRAVYSRMPRATGAACAVSISSPPTCRASSSMEKWYIADNRLALTSSVQTVGL